MEQDFEIKLLSDFSKEKRKAVKSEVVRMLKLRKWFGDVLLFRVLATSSRHAVFCAFNKGRLVGFLWGNKMGREFIVGRIRANSSKAILQEKGKTVGRLLVERAIEYADKRGLKIEYQDMTGSGQRFVQRLRAEKQDKPLEVKRKRHRPNRW